MTSRPGTLRSSLPLLSWKVRSRMAKSGMKVAPICCVMPPASPSCTQGLTLVHFSAQLERF